jgi:hypothetical protein
MEVLRALLLNVLTLFVDFLSFYALSWVTSNGSQGCLEVFVGYLTHDVHDVRLALDARSNSDYFY